MPVKPLPAHPDLNHLKFQAKDLLRARKCRTPESAQRIREFHPRFAGAQDAAIFSATFRLADAQLTIARERGFASWPRLKLRVERPTEADRLDLPHHERITDPAFRRAVDLLDYGDAAGLRDHLRRHPDLARRSVTLEGSNYFRNPTLLEFIAENPTRRGTLPANIVEVARVILEAGAPQAAMDVALALLASSEVAQRCGAQLALIGLLCEYGARPDEAARTAAMYAQWGAVNALLDRGARLDLPLATALGRDDDVRRLFPSSSAEDRHWSLAFAAQFDRLNIARMLLDAGHDPNHFNPVGGHSHATPLHHAAGLGHREMVKLLVERGAKLDWKDTMWDATPVEWARHEGKAEVEAYLLAQSRIHGSP